MAWPFTNVGPPTFEAFTSSLPLTLTSVTTAKVYLLGIHFSNSNTVPTTVTVRSTSGEDVLVNQVEIPPKGVIAFDINFKPMTGVQWNASLGGVAGSVWGY